MEQHDEVNQPQRKSSKHQSRCKSKSKSKHRGERERVQEQEREHPLLAELKREFRCGICAEILWHPATLLCGHNYCIHCLSRTISYHNLQSHQCPLCRAPIHGQTIRQNLSLIKLLENHYAPFYRRICESKDTEMLVEIYLETDRAIDLTREIERKLAKYTLISYRHLTSNILRALPPRGNTKEERKDAKIEILSLILEGKSRGTWNTVYDLVFRKTIALPSPTDIGIRIDWSLLDSHGSRNLPIISAKRMRKTLLRALANREIDIPKTSGRNVILNDDDEDDDEDDEEGDYSYTYSYYSSD